MDDSSERRRRKIGRVRDFFFLESGFAKRQGFEAEKEECEIQILKVGKALTER